MNPRKVERGADVVTMATGKYITGIRKALNTDAPTARRFFEWILVLTGADLLSDKRTLPEAARDPQGFPIALTMSHPGTGERGCAACGRSMGAGTRILDGWLFAELPLNFTPKSAVALRPRFLMCADCGPQWGEKVRKTLGDADLHTDFDKFMRDGEAAAKAASEEAAAEAAAITTKLADGE